MKHVLPSGRPVEITTIAQAVQLRFGGQGRERLPAGGWEQAVVWAFADARVRRSDPRRRSAFRPLAQNHVRAGGQIAGTATTSWLISGTLNDWRTWTGLPFNRTGPVEVPGALTTVHCDVDSNYAVYVEPNIWVRHRLRQ